MARIHSILQKSDFYYQLALEQVEQEGYTAAIKNLHKAINISQKDDYYIELAEAYNAVGAFDASNQVYFNLLAKRPVVYYLFAISRNYIEMEREDLATEFAYNTFISLGKKMSEEPIERLAHIGESEMFARVFSRIEDEGKAPILINIAEREEEGLMQQTYELINRGDFDKAIMHMLKIPPESDNYEEALDIICIAAIKNGDKEMAVKTARTLLQKNKKSITAFMALVTYGASLAEGEEYDEDALSQSLISAMQEDGDDAMLRSFASLLLGKKKYKQFYNASAAAYTLNDANNSGLFRRLLSAFIMGKKEEGERTLNKFVELYPHDKLSKLMQWRFSQKPTKAGWKKLPHSYFENIVEQYYQVAASSKHNFLTEREQALLDLILTGSNYFDFFEVIEYAFLKKGTIDYVISKLIDASIDHSGRLNLLKMLIMHGVERKVMILLPDRMDECQLRNIEPLPDYAEHFIISYSEAYVELLLSGYSPSPRRLGRIVKAFAKTQSTSNKVHIMAAILHFYYLQTKGEIISLDELAQIYGTTVRTLKKYLSIYQFDF
ncbi:MAG: hypothetical protein WC292_06450 [Clostridia bacterium]